ncbi:MAG: VCBS repeat-containing protein [Balneolaceae bacterium]
MMPMFSRRRRKILFTAIFSTFFFLIVAALIFKKNDPVQYVPGQPVDGVTSRLFRELPEDVPDVKFTDVTRKAGIDFIHFNGKRTARLAEDMGSGAAWIDFNNDGYEDLFIVNYSGSLDIPDEELPESEATPVLYRNNGNGTFTDVTEEAGLNVPVRGMGTAWADFNNNGWIDCLITAYGKNILFRNNGDGTFTDITEESGIDRVEGFWAGAAWGDFNLDGFLDIYITGYVSYFDIPSLENQAHRHEPPSLNPSVFEPVPNLLFMNNGDGTFIEIAEQAGVANPRGRSLEVVWIDLTYNGLPDLYVANDVSDNRFYRNMGDGTFLDISHSAKVSDYRGSMGMAFGDWDGDEDIDMFITHWIAEENALYNSSWSDNKTGGMIFFSDEADRLGLGQSSLQKVGWATSFFDFDNDGRPDLFVVNGHTNQMRDEPAQLVGMGDQLYWNRNNEEVFMIFHQLRGITLKKSMWEGAVPMLTLITTGCSTCSSSIITDMVFCWKISPVQRITGYRST